MTKKSETFADKFQELESITQWFERGDFSIEDALKKFERGLELAGELQKHLSEVERRVTEIKNKFKV